MGGHFDVSYQGREVKVGARRNRPGSGEGVSDGSDRSRGPGSLQANHRRAPESGTAGADGVADRLPRSKTRAWTRSSDTRAGRSSRSTMRCRRRFHHVLVRFEQWAALAAEGYARATGKPGVCMATSGPGATNLVTGLADAMLDSVPIVAITGQVIQPLIGRDAFQEVDITGITLPVTKHNYLVNRIQDLAPTIKEAFHLATSGRPGPVLIDIPKNASCKGTSTNTRRPCTGAATNRPRCRTCARCGWPRRRSTRRASR